MSLIAALIDTTVVLLYPSQPRKKKIFLIMCREAKEMGDF